LVRVDAALDAPLHGHADDAAEGSLLTGVHAEGRFEHELEDRNDLVGVDEGHGDGRDDVDDGHERRGHLGEVRDTLDSADDDEAHDDDSAIAVAQVGTFQAFSIAPEIALDWIPGSMKDMARTVTAAKTMP